MPRDHSPRRCDRMPTAPFQVHSWVRTGFPHLSSDLHGPQRSWDRAALASSALLGEVVVVGIGGQRDGNNLTDAWATAVAQETRRGATHSAKLAR